ncbi:MAG: UDP-2,3-diacylglucosamine diphosphatase LpxI [Nitrospirae bacterium]|nr:UDP-2,3-diacylglucosamine diphosphatase LpxI [Nitrospirota bacterium]
MNNASGLKIGIIAGMGELPIIIARDARARGFKVIIAALETLASEDIADFADEIKWISIGKFGGIIDMLKKAGVKEAIMAGKAPKDLLYKTKIVPDLKTIKLFFSLKDRSDETILNAITGELKNEGIDIIDTAAFSPGLLTPHGVITKTTPTKEEWKDIEYGLAIAKEIGRLDIGQTVVIKDQAVMAVEAIEGTDEAILRGGRLGGSGCVIVKVSRPNQDMRLDVPVVGSLTIKTMIDIKARILALEAGKSIIVQREKMINEAEKAGVSIVGINGNNVILSND